MLAGLAPTLLSLTLALAPAGGNDDDKNKQTIEGEILKTLRENGVITDKQFQDLTAMAERLRAQRTETDLELDREIKLMNEKIEAKVQASRPKGSGQPVSATWDNGIYLRSEDGDFSFHPWIVVRTRATYVDVGNVPGAAPAGVNPTTYALTNEDTLSFEERPVRFWFDGNAFGKDLTYLVNFDTNAGTGILRAAYVDYRFDDAFHVRVGQQIRPIDFEGFMYGPRTVLVEKAPATVFFQSIVPRAIEGFDPGMKVWGQALEKKLEYHFGVFNGDGPNNGPSLTDIGTGGIAFTPAAANNNDSSGLEAVGRVMYSPTGGFEPDAYGYTEGDYAKTPEPKFAFGTGASYNPERFTPGAAPTTKTINNIFVWAGDAVFKYDGLFAIAEYFYQHQDRAIQAGSNLTNQGYFGQVGYFFGSEVKNRGFEVIGRYSYIDVDSPALSAPLTATATTGVHDWTAGLNYVFFGHRLKIQTAYTYRERVVRALHNVYDNIVQVQLQFIF